MKNTIINTMGVVLIMFFKTIDFCMTTLVISYVVIFIMLLFRVIG